MLELLVSIDDSDELYRRVFHYHIIHGADRQVSSAVFKDRRRKPENRFSVDCAKLTTPQECLSRGKAGQRLIAFLAKAPRSLGFRVWHEPELDNVAHCTVEGENSSDKCDRLAEASWHVDVRITGQQST